MSYLRVAAFVTPSAYDFDAKYYTTSARLVDPCLDFGTISDPTALFSVQRIELYPNLGSTVTVLGMVSSICGRVSDALGTIGPAFDLVSHVSCTIFPALGLVFFHSFYQTRDLNPTFYGLKD